MIRLENTEILGWEPAIRGMRNPMNSWEKSDSIFFIKTDIDEYARDILGNESAACYANDIIGPNDLDLMMRLANAGSVDAKFRRMIVVYVDVTAPFYWWKEFDTYKVGTVANSCSTMHKIQAKEFVREDFSLEHLTEPNLNLMDMTIRNLNIYREKYLASKDKEDWWQMIQLLPTSYNQKRTIMLNYEVLAGLYPKRKNHKLDEWHVFCDWVKSLPYSEIIVGPNEVKNDPKYDIIFKEYWTDLVSNSTTLYFIAPKEMLGDQYPEAESMTISIEFPTHLHEAKYASVMRSPTKDGSDYDWSDYDIGLDEVERLMRLAEVKVADWKSGHNE